MSSDSCRLILCPIHVEFMSEDMNPEQGRIAQLEALVAYLIKKT